MSIVERLENNIAEPIANAIASDLPVAQGLAYINRKLGYNEAYTSHELGHAILGGYGFKPFNGHMDIEFFSVGISGVLDAINRYLERFPEHRSSLEQIFTPQKMMAIFKEGIETTFEQYKHVTNPLRLVLWLESQSTGRSTYDIVHDPENRYDAMVPTTLWEKLFITGTPEKTRSFKELFDENMQMRGQEIGYRDANGLKKASYTIDENHSVTFNCNTRTNQFGESLQPFELPPAEMTEMVFNTVLPSLISYVSYVANSSEHVSASKIMETMNISSFFDQNIQKACRAKATEIVTTV